MPLTHPARLELSFIRAVSMPICTAHRVARRFLTSAIRTAVVVHVDRLGNSWGWFASEIPRLHVVPLAPEHLGAARVWLEAGGKRCFEIDHVENGSQLDMGELHAAVSRSRDVIESEWLRSCQLRGWLAYCARDSVIALYFGTPHQLVRRLPQPAQSPRLLQLDTQTNSIWLEFKANRVIWLGADDGSDVDGSDGGQ